MTKAFSSVSVQNGETSTIETLTSLIADIENRVLLNHSMTYSPTGLLPLAVNADTKNSADYDPDAPNLDYTLDANDAVLYHLLTLVMITGRSYLLDEQHRIIPQRAKELRQYGYILTSLRQKGKCAPFVAVAINTNVGAIFLVDTRGRKSPFLETVQFRPIWKLKEDAEAAAKAKPNVFTRFWRSIFG